MRKRVLPIFLLILMMALSACAGKDAPQTAASDTGDTFNLTLYTDFSNGSPEGSIEEKQITLPAENEPASRTTIAFALADGLSDWTGLDFTLNDVSFPDDESIIVDWSKDSTLIAGIGDRPFREGFHFYDAISLNWFMMDSLATTFRRNMEIANVYYQSEGHSVTFQNQEDMAGQGLPELPVDQTYEGSAFFFAHAGGRGEGDVYEPGNDTNPGDGDGIVGEPIAEGVIFHSLLQSDPGNNMTAYEAASGLYDFVLRDKLTEGTDYSKEFPMFITCVDVVDINGDECYLLSVSGVFNTKAWEYAVDYDYGRQNVYLISEVENQLLGSLLDLG